jgi:hypothetical protein
LKWRFGLRKSASFRHFSIDFSLVFPEFFRAHMKGGADCRKSARKRAAFG